MDESASDEALRGFRRAEESLRDARVLFDGGGTDSGVVNRLYYAVFHAAQAVLYARGKTPSSHGDVRRQFGQSVVLECDAPRDDGRLLGLLYDYRLEADYGSGTPPDDVGGLVAEVDGFLDRMENLIPDRTRD